MQSVDNVHFVEGLSRLNSSSHIGEVVKRECRGATNHTAGYGVLVMGGSLPPPF